MTIKIKDNSYMDEDIIKCLVTCEKVISKNAYLEKKWKNYQLLDDGMKLYPTFFATNLFY